VKNRSSRQRKIEQLRMILKGKLFNVFLTNMEYQFVPDRKMAVIPCARCGKPNSVDYLDLDEVRGRHEYDTYPASLDPCNHQLLCRPCHEIKTDAGHIDFLQMNFPLVRMAYKRLAFEIARSLPEQYGKIKHSMVDIDKAIKTVCGVKK